MQAIFEIVGAEDFSDIVVAGGLKVSRNDIDSPKTGRSKMNAKMHRRRLAIKRKLSGSATTSSFCEKKDRAASTAAAISNGVNSPHFSKESATRRATKATRFSHSINISPSAVRKAERTVLSVCKP